MSYEDEITYLMDAVKRLSRPLPERLRNAPSANSLAVLAQRGVIPDVDQVDTPRPRAG
jgi:hypothetical protein